MKIVGLTGGIGSGKTTVANIFKEFDIPVFIADDEAKFLMNNSASLIKEITGIFGKEAYTEGKLNKKLIAASVFKDKALLEKLNSVVHPAVAEHFESWKKKVSAKYIIYEAAILFETGGHKKCDLTILVTADQAERIKRLQKRDHSTYSEIQVRMSNQWPDEKKLNLADYIIQNNEISETRKKVEKIHHILLQSP